LLASGFYAPEIQKERIKKMCFVWPGIRSDPFRYALGCASEAGFTRIGSIQIAPVGSHAYFNDDGHGKPVNAFHFFFNQLF
jgi:hypothetical protein